MSEVRRYQPVGRGETVPDKYGRYCKYEDVEHWIGMYNLCNEREQSLLAERDRLREALEDARRTLDDAQEINPSNYDHDQVCDMNCAYCAAYAIIEAALQEAGDE